MKVMLLFPPHWTPAMPHLALPALTGYLRSRNVEVVQRDLNVEVFDRVLTRDYLLQAVDRMREDRRRGRALPGREAAHWAETKGPELAAQVEAAKADMRGDAFFAGPRGLQAFLVLSACLELASLPFHPASLEFSTYTPPAPADSSRSLLAAARDPQANMFLDLFRQGILRDLEREPPDLVGISIPTLGQMLSAVTLALLIKESGLPCHVTVGGPHITMLREELAHVPALFDLFDSAIVFDGEEPLLRLLEALAGRHGLAQVPGLIYRDGRVRATPLAQPPAPAELPAPDFHGLPLDRYLAPGLVLPLVTSRGCYHGRCAFCNVGYGGPRGYRTLPPEQVVERMLALQREYGARHVFFADEAMAPRSLRRMSALLQEKGSPVAWCGCVRLEKALTGDLLASMARAGCRMLLFGLETASPPIMARMVKGTQREEMGRVLRQSAQAGIWNHTFFFFGFPGETIEHAQETVNFVYEHQQAIHSASPGAFLLERYAPAERHPDEFGIRRIVRRPDRDLAIYFDYAVESGMDEPMAEHLVSRFLDVLPQKPFAHYYVHDVYRLLYAGRLHEQGLPFPPWLVPEEAGAA